MISGAKLYQINANTKKAGVLVLISGKAEFRSIHTIWSKGKQFKMFHGIIHSTDITVMNTYALNSIAVTFIDQKLWEIPKYTLK